VVKRVNTIIGTITIYGTLSASTLSSKEVLSSLLSNCYCRVLNARDKSELCKFKLPNFGTQSSQVMCKIHRKSLYEPNMWLFTAIGESLEGSSVVDLIEDVEDRFADNWGEMYKWNITRITVVGAKELIAVNKKGNYSNAFVSLVEPDFGKPVKTLTQYKTLRPVWNFKFEVGMIQRMIFEVCHERETLVKGKDVIGEVILDIQSLSIGMEHDVLAEIVPSNPRDRKGQSLGVLHLRVGKLK